MHINAQPLEHRQVCVTWCGLVHVELAGYQNLQDLNQRIQTRLRPEHRDTTSSVLLTKWVKGFLCFILLIITLPASVASNMCQDLQAADVLPDISDSLNQSSVTHLS